MLYRYSMSYTFVCLGPIQKFEKVFVIDSIFLSGSQLAAPIATIRLQIVRSTAGRYKTLSPDRHTARRPDETISMTYRRIVIINDWSRVPVE
jgi:hypothetical protein